MLKMKYNLAFIINKLLGTGNIGTAYISLELPTPSQFHLEGQELTATLAAELLDPLSITELAFELTDDNPLL